MKCEDCVYFEGRDYETGEPECSPPGETCPFEEEGKEEVKDGKVVVSIDLSDMQLRIEHAFRNAIGTHISRVVDKLIQDEFGKSIRAKTAETVEALLTQKVAEFMEQPIHIGGGWREPERTLTRNEYITELVDKRLNNNFDADKMAEHIASTVKRSIDRFAEETKTQVNRQVKEMFDTATRANLTDSIVSLLMDNETYRSLSSSLQHLIGGAVKE